MEPTRSEAAVTHSTCSLGWWHMTILEVWPPLLLHQRFSCDLAVGFSTPSNTQLVETYHKLWKDALPVNRPSQDSCKSRSTCNDRYANVHVLRWNEEYVQEPPNKDILRKTCKKNPSEHGITFDILIAIAWNSNFNLRQKSHLCKFTVALDCFQSNEPQQKVNLTRSSYHLL